MRLEEIEVGSSAEHTKTITEADLILFAGITGDFNPLHMNAEAAARSRFGGRIAHGMLTASLLSTLVGMKIPGKDALYMSQTLRFTKPVRIGDTITARAEVLEVMRAKRRVRMRTTCRNQDGETVLEGEALVMVMEPTDQGRR
jgi:3-hydroxybutyryl-CoA dehydratase